MGLRGARLVAHGLPGSDLAGRMAACARQARLLGISPAEQDPVRIISIAQIQLRRLRRTSPARSDRPMEAADRIRMVMEARDALLWRTLARPERANTPQDFGDHRPV